MTRLAVLRCVGVMRNGERCEAKAIPGTRRCGIHADPPRGRARCQHQFDNGRRCEARIPTYRLGVDNLCGAHRAPCANPDGCPKGRTVGVAGALCPSCTAVLAREVALASRPAVKTHRQRWEDTFGSLPRCTEMSAETGQPCVREASPGSDRCHKHRNLPADEDRCTYEWANGKRCPRRAVVKTGQRCTHHRVAGAPIGRPIKGEEPVFTPCPECGKPTKGSLGCADHAPRCQGTTAAGKPCSRFATVRLDTGTFCASHAARHVTPPPPPLKGEPVRCGLPSGKDGAPCGAPAVLGGSRCWKHSHLPESEDRCQHLYPAGHRCPARSRAAHGHGHGQVCAVHAVPCVEDGCHRKTTNIEFPLCPKHTPTCAARVDDDRPCQKKVIPGTGYCPQHQEDRDLDGPRCQHQFSNGLTCGTVLTANGTNVWRELCARHQTACSVDGCRTRSSFLNGLCWRHQPRCSTADCRVSAVVDGKCLRHHQLEQSGGCSLLTLDGRPCLGPGTVPSEEGPICALHDAKMPPPEIRCAHVYDTGERCALRSQDGTLYCQPHQPAHQERCSWLTTTGQPCGRSFTPRPGLTGHTCEQHRRVPANDDRCVVRVAGGAQRCPGTRVAGTNRCIEHVRTQRCSVYLANGERCSHELLVRLDGVTSCFQHQELLPDRKRCVAEVAPGHRCPGRKEWRKNVCDVHRTQQPRCIAIDSRGVRCPNTAPTGYVTCDRHAEWVEGQLEDPAEAYERFFLRPRLDLLWELVYEQSGLGEELARPEMSQDASTFSQQESNTASRQDDDVADDDIDPYDLTGAKRFRAELLAEGTPEDEANNLAELVSQRYARNTIVSLTAQLRPYLVWCQENCRVPVPAERRTIAQFLNYLVQRGRVWDGKPLSGSTMRQFRTAIAKAHTVLGKPDPFDLYPDLVSVLAGYDRQFSRPAIQAHAVRIDELAALMTAATGLAMTNLRDAAIVTVVADPEVGMNQLQATRLRWEGVRLGDPDDPDQPTTLLIDRPKRGFDELTVPNRIAEVIASGQEFPDGEMPVIARMCGTSALRVLASSRSSAGLPLSGPVFVSEEGQAISNVGLAKVLRTAAGRAGVPYSATFNFDTRVRVLDALAEPPLLGLRDRAIMAIAWWASLRRSEIAALDLGDIGKDSRGRGLVVLVRKSKTDINGQFVPVPYAKYPDGTVMVVDLAGALHAWLDAYAKYLGRPLTDEDPLFINVQNKPGSRLSDDGVALVIKRYASMAGVEAELGERISSHGFRAGYATEWLASGRPAEPLARRQRRKSTQSVLGYFRLADPFEDSLSFVFDAPDDATFDLEALITQHGRRRAP